MRNLFVETDVVAKQPLRNNKYTVNREPVLCSVCGLEIPGCDAEIKALNRMRHYQQAHGIPRCHPDAWE